MPALASQQDPAGSASAHPRRRRQAIEGLRLASTGLVAGLILLGLSWETWLAPLAGGHGRLALKVVPLLFALPGVLRHRLYTYRWLSLLVWLYVTEGVLRTCADAPPSRWLAVAELSMSLALFAACGAYVRLRLRAAHQGPAQLADAADDSASANASGNAPHAHAHR